MKTTIECPVYNNYNYDLHVSYSENNFKRDQFGQLQRKLSV